MPNTSNISPAFAREASQLLHDGDIQRATELCIAGTSKFPNYATGFLILGKCCDIAGRAGDALKAYRHALALLPDHSTLHELARQAEAKGASAMRTEREETDTTQVEPAPIYAPVNESHSRATEVQPPVISPHRVEPITPSPTPVHEASEQTAAESTLDYLTRRLQNVKRIKPNPSTQAESVRVENVTSQNFVTPTMAEIYVGQGEYKEAIKAYSELLKQNPAEEKFKRRVAEIEQLLLVQAKEKI